MAELLKNMINGKVIKTVAHHFKKNWPPFNDGAFINEATRNVTSLELKERTEHITTCMIRFFPSDFKQSGKILRASLGAPLDDGFSGKSRDDSGITGWAIMSLVHYVALQGQDHFELAMELLKEMTKRASSEFGIRYFLLQSPEKTLAVLQSWTKDNNHHVRRLASEGCRPRLPWAMTLPAFIEDPAPVLALLEELKDDKEEYVRRSVANNLNDIAKDHPELVFAVVSKWLVDADDNRRKLIKHACRTLIKNGHKQTLALLGYRPPKIKHAIIRIATPKVVFGGALEFELRLHSKASANQALMIDYSIHHQKANGRMTPKVFKWRVISLAPKETIRITKKHVMKKITTRVYYAGLHQLEIMVNGKSLGKRDFQLVMN